MKRLLLAVMWAAHPCLAQEFQHVAIYRGHGTLAASAVGPGPKAGADRFYINYFYVDNTIEVVAVGPDTGEHQVFLNPTSNDFAVCAMAVGPDGDIYVGTAPGAHLLKLDPKAGTLVDMGRSSQTGYYIWDAAFGADGKQYGATSPQAKLVRYDPGSDRLEDLGRIDSAELYAHSVAGCLHGFVYMGIGASRANIAAYEISTGALREILPKEFQQVGQASVCRAHDGKVYSRLPDLYFRLQGWTATPIAAKKALALVPPNVLRDGRTVNVQGLLDEKKAGFKRDVLLKALRAEGVRASMWDYPEQRRLNIYSEFKWWHHPPVIPHLMPGNRQINATHIFMPLRHGEDLEPIEQHARAFEKIWAHKSELAKL